MSRQKNRKRMTRNTPSLQGLPPERIGPAIQLTLRRQVPSIARACFPRSDYRYVRTAQTGSVASPPRRVGPCHLALRAQRFAKMASPGGISPAGARVVPPLFGKRTHKPNSVLCGHSSRRRVTADAHQRPTRRFQPLARAALARRAGTPRGPGSSAHASLPIWSCSVWGLPCLRHYWRSGALLPHHFTLTPAGGLAVQANLDGSSGRPAGPERPGRGSRGGIFSVALCRLRAFTPASRTLSGTLPCGVRTFLPRRAAFADRRQRPPGPPASP